MSGSRNSDNAGAGGSNSIVNVGNRKWRVNLRCPDLDLCVPVRPYEGAAAAPSAFGLPKPTAEPTRSGSWVGSVDHGASVNVPTLSLCTHGSCTHTECIGHIVPGDVHLGDIEPVPPFVGGVLLSVGTQRLGECADSYASPKASDDDLVVTAAEVRRALDRVLGLDNRAGSVADASADGAGSKVSPAAALCLSDPQDRAFLEAVVLRVEGFDCWDAGSSGGNDDDDQQRRRTGRDFSGSNWPYLTREAMALLCGDGGFGVEHVLINLPSVDREDDGGVLQNHRMVFRYPAGSPPLDVASQRQSVVEGKRRLLLPCYSVTELCDVPAAAREGRVLLSLQVSPIQMDAAPSRPLLFYLEESVEENTNDHRASPSFVASELRRLRRVYAEAGQSHVFDYEAKLSDAERANLVRQLRSIDPAAVLDQYQRTISVSKASHSGGVTPCTPTRLDQASNAERELWRHTGLAAIGAGRVGVLLLAGGQGTRLGFSQPKGCFPGTPAQPHPEWLASGKTLFQLQAERIKRLENEASRLTDDSANPERSHGGGKIQWYIMTSPMTHADTLADFALHNYYGLEADQVHFFQQGVLPCLSVVDGEEDDDDAAAAGVKFIMKSPSELATAPDGNGGIYKALHASSSVDGDASMISDMERRGVQHLFANAVDNCACKVADPVFLGFCAQGNFLAANKVTEKRSPTEKVGLQCRRGGCFEVVEYSDVDPAIRDAVDGTTGKLLMSSGSVCIHYFSLGFLREQCHPSNLATALDFHVARKRIPVWDPAVGAAVLPETESPNGVKLETFIFDVFKLAGEAFGVFEVQREEEFAPIKNASGPGIPDSPATAAEQLCTAHKAWLLAAGAILTNESTERERERGIGFLDVEISPLVSYSGEGLASLVKGRPLECPFMIMEPGFVPRPDSRAAGATVEPLGDGSRAVYVKLKPHPARAGNALL